MKRISLALAMLLVLLPSMVKADTLRTFAITDQLGNTNGAHGLTGTLSGFITIDTTTGAGLNGSIQYLYNGDFNQFQPPLDMSFAAPIVNSGCLNHCEDLPNTHQMKLGSVNADVSSLNVVLSTPTGLIDYMGGNLCQNMTCDPDAYNYIVFQNFPYQSFTIGNNHVPAGMVTGTDYFYNAKLSLVSEVVTPEPSSWLLMGTESWE